MMSLGAEGEALVAREYEKLGFKILERNYRIHFSKQVGEIDLIAAKENLLTFIEVKTRQSEAFGGALEAVGYSKRQKLIKMAKLFLMKNQQYQDWDYRIDVAAVEIDNGRPFVKILVNAIEDFN